MLIEHLGDIVVTIPLLRSLRIALPDSTITVVVSDGGFPLIEHCPYVDNIVVAKAVNNWLARFQRACSLARSIRSLNIDFAIVPKDAPNKELSELICILGSCKWRLSRTRPKFIYRVKPLKFRPIYDEVLVEREVRHEVQSRLQLAQRFSEQELSAGLEAWLTQDDLAFADNFFKRAIGTFEGPILGFGIGASGANRIWPFERYVQVIEQMNALVGARALLIVSPEETEAARKIVRMASSPIYFCENATVRQSMALLRHCTLFIGNDSGPMHMAASVRVPVVEISCHPSSATSWSINSPMRYGPYGVPRQILQPIAMEGRCISNGCSSKHAPHCILQVTPDAVIEAALRLLEKSSSSESTKSKSSLHTDGPLLH